MCQIVLLAAEQRLTAPAIAVIVREDDQTVRNWLKRWMAEGIVGLHNRPMPGAPTKITAAYEAQLLETVHRRPRSLEQPFLLWTLPRLLDYLEAQAGLRVSDEPARTHLRAHGISFSQPQHNVSSPDPEYMVKKGD